MSWQFAKHYSVAEARSLLPQIREWLERLAVVRRRVERHETQTVELLAHGADLGGREVNQWVRYGMEVQLLIQEFESREIQIKDLERGLIDFPSIRDGREVFLCWEKDEEDIGHWHDLEGGYSGRERI
jgi:hypothetical protein